MTKPHVLVIPLPAQGHVIPIMELARRLAKKGVKVTFVNTEAIHKVMTNNLLEKDDDYEDLLHMVSIPDGLEPWEDRNNIEKVTKSIFESMPRKLEELVQKINKQDCNKITCIVADNFMGWAIRVAKKMGIRTAAFWPASSTSLATIISFQKLINDGVINNDGVPLNNDDMIWLSETMPPIKPENLPWMSVGDVATIEILVQTTRAIAEGAILADRVICNSSIALEPSTFNQFPQVVPIGPLLASNRLANQTGHFWQEDPTCLQWLDQQSPSSVLYVAFGSITILNQTQFTELALGLEFCNRPFLWVVRKDMSVAFPDGYVERVGSRGKIVSWAPQQKVLGHRSVACVLSHCGWNSTVEGVINGVPFLCWPYFADQFLNETYVCDVWKSGLGLRKDEQGIVSSREIICKVEQLLGDKLYKDKALEIKEKLTSSVKPGGSSHQNLFNFIEWIQQKDTHATSDQYKV